ncbi:MAG: hypothetical protein KVP17_002668 [Porospora cf. gigantea B]|uniref:uncharacterized protein n=1 Tax=Porospora cf. gigantea B TaxID=2853592 RepID=UPI0035717D3B|nr:MAG: hypothetical protein KVP17_002668 [Porospora cf. gigantea B]
MASRPLMVAPNASPASSTALDISAGGDSLEDAEVAFTMRDAHRVLHNPPSATASQSPVQHYPTIEEDLVLADVWSQESSAQSTASQTLAVAPARPVAALQPFPTIDEYRVIAEVSSREAFDDDSAQFWGSVPVTPESAMLEEIRTAQNRTNRSLGTQIMSSLRHPVRSWRERNIDSDALAQEMESHRQWHQFAYRRQKYQQRVDHAQARRLPVGWPSPPRPTVEPPSRDLNDVLRMAQLEPSGWH